MSLQEQGFRFVLQDGEFDWLHPALIKPEAVDLTDLSEHEFSVFVERELAKRPAERLAKQRAAK